MIGNIYKNIIVIGGNAAGLAAANQIRRINKDLNIKVFESGNYISYGSCSLPHYISGTISNIDSILNYSVDYFLENKNIEIFLRHKAVLVNSFKKEVIFNTDYENGFSNPGKNIAFSYDRLVICSGASPSKLNIEGSDAKNVFTFRKVEDAINLRAFIETEDPKEAVIIGGGYIGLLLADSLNKRGIKITIVEVKEKILSEYEADVSDILYKELLNKGIKIFNNTKITKINCNKITGKAHSVTLESSLTLPRMVQSKCQQTSKHHIQIFMQQEIAVLLKI